MLIMTLQNTIISDNQIIRMLQDSGVRPSVHRMAVLSYVANRKTHPKAEEIFSAIVTEFPTVSKTTVYNSLHTLVEAGLLRELDIESASTRYDLARQVPHSHFRCKRCGKIFDMSLPEKLDSVVAPGFKVDTADLYFNGLCPECATEK